MRKLLRGTALLVLPICFSLSAIGTGLAQNTNSGDIRGSVTDSTGAVLPGVTVTVLDVDKNVTHTYVTNSSGLYDTGSIVPDNYTLTFTKDGFETYVRGPIVLMVGTTGIDAQLKVGCCFQQSGGHDKHPAAADGNRIAVDHADSEEHAIVAAGGRGLGELHHLDARHIGHTAKCFELLESGPGCFRERQSSLQQRTGGRRDDHSADESELRCDGV